MIDSDDKDFPAIRRVLALAIRIWTLAPVSAQLSGGVAPANGRVGGSHAAEVPVSRTDKTRRVAVAIDHAEIDRVAVLDWRRRQVGHDIKRPILLLLLDPHRDPVDAANNQRAQIAIHPMPEHHTTLQWLRAPIGYTD